MDKELSDLVIESWTLHVNLLNVHWTCMDVHMKCSFGLVQFSSNVIKVVIESHWKVLGFYFKLRARTPLIVPIVSLTSIDQSQLIDWLRNSLCCLYICQNILHNSFWGWWRPHRDWLHGLPARLVFSCLSVFLVHFVRYCVRSCQSAVG